MRKFLVILLVGCLTLGVVGCSSESAETSSASEPIIFELMPKDADLTQAPDVIVEPEDEPYNLGGWKAGNTVSWDLEIEEAGIYDIVVNYSRSGQDMAWGIMDAEMSDGQTERINFEVMPSGDTEAGDDWSVYIDNANCSVNLPAGETKILVFPNREMSSTYFINLRSITLTSRPADTQTVPMDKHLEKYVGVWYKNGNTQDQVMQINEANSWALCENESGNFEAIAGGQLKYEQGQIGFIDTVSDNTYYSDPTSDGSLRYIGDYFFPSEGSVEGFDEYNGDWYLEGDEQDDFLRIENGHWYYFESLGVNLGATSSLNGYMASDGKDDLFTYNASTNEKTGRIGLVTDDVLSFDRRDYYLIETEEEDELSAWYGIYANKFGAIRIEKSAQEGYLHYEMMIGAGDKLSGELLPNDATEAADAYLKIFLVEDEEVQVTLVDESLDADFIRAFEKEKRN